MGLRTSTGLPLAADHQQTDIVFQLAQAFQQVAVALHGIRRTHAVSDGPLLGGGEHDAPLLQGQLASFFVKRSELIEQMLAAAQTNVAAQIGRGRILALIQHMQKGQRGVEALAGPGCVITNGRG
ncbi:hypothetical protein D9M69_452050 [compost metagenome]